MKNRDFLVQGDGNWQVFRPAREWDLLRTPYHFHRFLTEVEDILEQTNEKGLDEATDLNCLAALCLTVRRLVTNSYWVHTQVPEPHSSTGLSAMMLYDEIGFPLTVQTAIALSETVSTIHSHGNWGIVAILKGEEKNTLWRRIADPAFPERVEAVNELLLLPGDIVCFTPDAIHSIQAVGAEPTFSFSIYGETHHSRRFEFDPLKHTAKNF
jgi:predicted metal-dependent enzyme (double-stranded beta helix superfamily)